MGIIKVTNNNNQFRHDEESIDDNSSVDNDGDGDDNVSIGSSSSSSDSDLNNNNNDMKDSNSSSNKSVDGYDNYTKDETKQILYLRIIVGVVLLLAAIIVSVVIYYITDKNEHINEREQYEAATEKIIQTFNTIITEKMGVAGSFVISIISHGYNLNEKWPFVTLTPNFQERAQTIKELSGAVYISINPLITDYKRTAWEYYSTKSIESIQYYNNGIKYQTSLGIIDENNLSSPIETDDLDLNLTTGIANHIYKINNNDNKAIINPISDTYLPTWQTSPIDTKRSMINQNINGLSEAINICLKENVVVFDKMQYKNESTTSNTEEDIEWLLSLTDTKYKGDIYTKVYFPIIVNDFIHDKYNTETTTVGIMRIIIYWAKYFENILPSTTKGIILVLDNKCDTPYTYRIDGPTIIPLGHGDLHDTKYDNDMVLASLHDNYNDDDDHNTIIDDGTIHGIKLHHNDICEYTIRIYKSDIYMNEYHNSAPIITTVTVAFVFILTIIIFICYDRLVERRQRLLLNKAKQTHAIITSLFPIKHIRDKLLNDAANNSTDGNGNNNNKMNKNNMPLGTKQALKSIVSNGGVVKDNGNTKNLTTIADLFPEATVLFADIAGFTAWSSSREPAQVFILLQHVYQAFDAIAHQRHVFKVETIGDSYVAVTGLPDPQPNHAVIMARFAYDCMVKLHDVTVELETTLGPDTSDLSLRCGLHSGPVTAGVLRGDRSRFQLFGDTVNTASRLESTGKAGRIQCSSTTGELLVKAGKAHWVIPRNDDDVAKGKGVISTCWVAPHAKQRTSSAVSSNTGSNFDPSGRDMILEEEAIVQSARRERYIDWMTEVFKESMNKIAARRLTVKHESLSVERKEEGIPLDEVVDTLSMPAFDSKMATQASSEVPAVAKQLLREYISNISTTYRDNPFHNFEHACHVTMNTAKFLSRIVAPEIDLDKINNENNGSSTLEEGVLSHLHDYTHGLNSDPLTIFAILFSSLIHDVDHRGISNVQLGKENPDMAAMYREKSLAEQNSLDIAWTLFMNSRFKPLREFLFCNPADMDRFRQIVFNVVLATDIFDKDLNDIRKARWARAFAPDVELTGSVNDLRATIVMEHIMQASDVCHTMQHWHVYRSWNARLFCELSRAYRTGRMGADPATFWYKGEIGFFDNYIIPLAKKLKDCNVFGVSSDECLNYALMNRAEWEARGEQIVEELVEEFSWDGEEESLPCRGYERVEI